MKKTYWVFIVAIAIICFVCYLLYSKKNELNTKQGINRLYEKYYETEVNGIDLATLINKAYDQNVLNRVEKNDSDLFISNDTNSINIELSFKDSDKVYHFEKIYINGTEKFVELYSNVSFKCDKVDYHDKTKIVKYLHFTEN